MCRSQNTIRRTSHGLSTIRHLQACGLSRRDMQNSFRNYINGRWETGVTTATSENPSDLASPVGEYARADGEQTELAIRAAAEATSSWAFATPQRRADALDQIGSEILARKDELGELLA